MGFIESSNRGVVRGGDSMGVTCEVFERPPSVFPRRAPPNPFHRYSLSVELVREQVDAHVRDGDPIGKETHVFTAARASRPA
jgi:hypothetical protein